MVTSFLSLPIVHAETTVTLLCPAPIANAHASTMQHAVTLPGPPPEVCTMVLMRNEWKVNTP